MCFDFLYNVCLKSKNNWARYNFKMYTGLRVKHPFFLSELKLQFSRQILDTFLAPSSSRQAYG
jgi:hypothetical protein